MSRWPYDEEVVPPAPFVSVRLRDMRTGAELGDLPAQIDTAAFRSVVPLAAVVALGCRPWRACRVIGFGGAVADVPTYAVELTIPGHVPHQVEVIAHDGEPWVLLGRDVLNRLRVVLDGPTLTLHVFD